MVVATQIFLIFTMFHPEIWGKVSPNLTCAYFFRWVGWSHQLEKGDAHESQPKGDLLHRKKIGLISWTWLGSNQLLGGGNSNIFWNFYSGSLGIHDPIWRAYFSNGLVQPPTRSGITIPPSRQPTTAVGVDLGVEASTPTMWMHTTPI